MNERTFWVYETTPVRLQQLIDRAAAEGRERVAVVYGLSADDLTVLQVYSAVRWESRRPTALLESVEQSRNVGRFSFIGCDPAVRFTVRGDQSEAMPLRSELGSPERKVGEPLAHLKTLLRQYTPVAPDDIAPFLGGAIGQIGFSAVSLSEPSVPRHAVDDSTWPDIELYFYDRLIVFDHVRQNVYLVACLPVRELKNQRALDRIREHLPSLRLHGKKLQPLQALAGVGEEVCAALSRQVFERMVGDALQYVIAGEVFQVVLSQRFSVPFNGDTLEIYRHLRRANPSPYLFHLDCMDDRAIVGASPEVMVRVRGGKVFVRPLAGTRRRGATAVEDEALRQELAEDPKERAEHRMLVDLARNDVGRVSEPGSVVVSGALRVEAYGAVHHMVTDVEGTLRSDLGPLDAFLACWPAGTVSGAPKVRACQVIAALEPCARGPYAGAVGWFTDREIDTCITIRSLWVADQRVTWQTGAGIVADSVPAHEYEETLAKGRSIRQLFEAAANSMQKK